MRNKTGDVLPKALYILIIFSVIFLLYVVLSGNYGNFLKSFFEKGVCKESVRSHSRGHIGGIEVFSNVNCPVEYETIEKDEDIKERLAYHMADCWDKYGEGRLKLFSNEVISTEKFCAVCSHIKFDEKTVINAKSFLEYLGDTPAPQKFSGDVFDERTISYYTYLSGYKTEELDLSNPEIGKYDINTDEPYGVLFTYTKKGDLVSVYTLREAVIGAGIGFIAGVTTGVLAPPIKGVPFIGKAVGSGKTVLAMGLVGAIGGAYGAVRLVGVPQQVDSAVVLIPYDEIELQKLNCEIFPVKPSIKKEK